MILSFASKNSSSLLLARRAAGLPGHHLLRGGVQHLPPVNPQHQLTTPGAAASFSTPAKKGSPEGGDDPDAISPVTLKRQQLSKTGKHVVWGTRSDNEALPAPVLPQNPSEISKLDPMDRQFAALKADGSKRTVVIRQEKASARQSPLQPESSWRIFFYEDGTISEKWNNSLMGWTSNADPYQSGNPITFPNAADAVYFAKKRGWNYVVKQPILRYLRNDDAQYQDNFLSQATAAKVQMEGTSCDEWKRSSAATSHYFRPLTYHGDKTVRQHGPNCEAETVPHVQGVYKMR